MQLKQIDPNATQFEANGKTYHIEGSLSIQRFNVFQKLELEAGYNVGFEGIFKALNTIYELANNLKLADVCVLTANTLRGVSGIENRRNAVLSICTLFLNTEKEDRKKITEDMMEAKIADWDAEGIPMDFFLAIASNLVRNYWTNLEEMNQRFSPLESKQKA